MIPLSNLVVADTTLLEDLIVGALCLMKTAARAAGRAMAP